MKKLIFTLALLAQFSFAMADDNAKALYQARKENVKMYRQASASTDVVLTLNPTDKVELVRKHNRDWDLVTVNGTVGYVRHFELVKPKKEKAK